MTALADKLRALEAIVGESRLVTSTDGVADYRVDGQQPLGVARPRTPEQVAELLRSASEAGLSVLVRGAGKHLHLGAPPEPIGVVLLTTDLDEIIEHDAENLTITAQAGTTLAALRKIAQDRGQMLPLDPPGGDEATIGGIAATNLTGTLRARYGAPRDLILGVRVALADGSPIRCGGKTVKNVAGYELTKLFVGSLGTLGAIYEVTVRLVPAPAARVMLAAALAPARVRALAAELLRSPLDVATLDLANTEAVRRMRLSLPLALDSDLAVCFIGLLGDEAALARQERELRARVDGAVARLNGDEADVAFRALRDLPSPRDNDVVARAGVPISTSPLLLEMVSAWEGWWAAARGGAGPVYAGPPDGAAVEEVEGRLRELREAAEREGGYTVLEAGPLELKRRFAVWGDVPNADLMRQLKEAYDPNRTLGCGRYVSEL
jgi:glycolate oxidase FAD binding subunit